MNAQLPQTVAVVHTRPSAELLMMGPNQEKTDGSVQINLDQTLQRGRIQFGYHFSKLRMRIVSFIQPTTF